MRPKKGQLALDGLGLNTEPLKPPAKAKRRKGHFIRLPATVHLQAFKTPEHSNCYAKEVGGISYESSKKAQKTSDPDKVTCPHCKSTFVGTNAYGALKAASS